MERQIPSRAMAMDLAALVDPRHTAVITSEVQNSVVGEQSALPVLAEVARPMVANVARLCLAARDHHTQVVHCTAARRNDGKGSNRNARLFLGVLKSPVTMLPGSVNAAVVPELGPHDDDIVLTRLHGLNPMAGTDLDPVLRNLGVTTIIVTGVSVNIAITNLVMDAVNAGYQVVVPRDAVTGIPADYADAVVDNTLALLATITSTDDVIGAWRGCDG